VAVAEAQMLPAQQVLVAQGAVATVLLGQITLLLEQSIPVVAVVDLKTQTVQAVQVS
jgi:hypothetical protein